MGCTNPSPALTLRGGGHHSLVIAYDDCIMLAWELRHHKLRCIKSPASAEAPSFLKRARGRDCNCLHSPCCLLGSCASCLMFHVKHFTPIFHQQCIDLLFRLPSQPFHCQTPCRQEASTRCELSPGHLLSCSQK